MFSTARLLTRSVRTHQASLGHPFRRPQMLAAKVHHSLLRRSARHIPPLVFVGGFGAGIASICIPSIHCDALHPVEDEPAYEDISPPPSSSVSLFQLTFGTVTGVCAGIFIKKGVKAAAWVLGGVFVLLQYLRSVSLIRVNWPRLAAKFEDLFYIRDASGNRRPPTIKSVWLWLVNFLTADFQPRASFVAGLALGLRIG